MQNLDLNLTFDDMGKATLLFGKDKFQLLHVVGVESKVI